MPSTEPAQPTQSEQPAGFVPPPSHNRPTNPYIEQLSCDTLHQVRDGLSWVKDSLTGLDGEACGETLMLERSAAHGLVLQLQGLVEAIDYEAQRIEHAQVALISSHAALDKSC